MKFSKENKIIIGLLALIIVLSVGYALFSETITIKGSATAKGDFGFTTTCDAGLSKDLEDIFGAETILQGGYKEEYCEPNGTTVDFGATLEFPTAARAFTVTMKNTGSIPAKFNPEEDIIISSSIVDEENGREFQDVSFLEGMLMAVSIDGQIYVDSEEFPETAFDSEGNIVINPNDSLIIVASAVWNYLGTNEYNHTTTVNKNTITVNFEQITAE